MTTGPLEVPVDRLDEAVRAAAWADRLEICADLDAHGWTPDLALIRSIRKSTSIPCVVLLRSPSDVTPLEAMRSLIVDAARAGVTAFAFGELDRHSRLEEASNRALAECCRDHGGLPCLHRAFDRHPDADLVAELGIRRVLCAGTPHLDHTRDPLADRLTTIGRRVAEAAGRFEIVACGGVRSATVTGFLAASPLIHSSCRVRAADGAGAIAEKEIIELHRATDHLRPPRPAPAG